MKKEKFIKSGNQKLRHFHEKYSNDAGLHYFHYCRKPAVHNIKIAERIAVKTISRIRHPNNTLHNLPNELLYRVTNIKPSTLRLRKIRIYRNFIKIIHIRTNPENSQKPHLFGN